MPVNVYYLCYVSLVPGCYEERENGLLSTIFTCAKWPMIHGVSVFFALLVIFWKESALSAEHGKFKNNVLCKFCNGRARPMDVP